LEDATRNLRRKLSRQGFDLFRGAGKFPGYARFRRVHFCVRLASRVLQHCGALFHQFPAIRFLLRVHLRARLPQRFLVLAHFLRGRGLRRLRRLLRANRARVALGHDLQQRLKENRPHDDVEKEDDNRYGHSPEEQFA
jgi:hypothetical protein